jgi:hypothetical protein
LVTKKLDELAKRVEKLEKQNTQQIVTLVEILSNATFFGDLKKASCEYAKDGQCKLFFLKKEPEFTIPIATACRIKNCGNAPDHFHIEISNLTCSFCPQQKENQISVSLKKPFMHEENTTCQEM